jgi:hypothetical protein
VVETTTDHLPSLPIQDKKEGYSVSQGIYCCSAGKDCHDDSCYFALCVPCNAAEGGVRKRGRAGEESKKKTCRCGKERTTLDMFVDSTYYKPVLLNRIDYNMPRECAVCKIEFVQ